MATCASCQGSQYMYGSAAWPAFARKRGFGDRWSWPARPLPSQTACRAMFTDITCCSTHVLTHVILSHSPISLSGTAHAPVLHMNADAQPHQEEWETESEYSRRSRDTLDELLDRFQFYCAPVLKVKVKKRYGCFDSAGM